MLRHQIAKIGRDAGARSIATAYFDFDTETSWSYRGEQWMHAASTIKVAILIALYEAVAEGRFPLEARLHVRNRFLSAVDGTPFRVSSERDANAEVQAAIGKSMRLRELALHMISTSSNLATNLLLDLVGVEYARKVLRNLGVRGVDLRRGVEDERAHEAGINNQVTALGLVHLFRLILNDEIFTPEASQDMIDILLQQEFRSGIPAGLPGEARVAHKTGEISTVAHDSGIIFLPGRKPYILSVLTEWDQSAAGRKDTVAAVSRLVYEHLTMPEPEA